MYSLLVEKFQQLNRTDHIRQKTMDVFLSTRAIFLEHDLQQSKLAVTKTVNIVCLPIIHNNSIAYFLSEWFMRSVWLMHVAQIKDAIISALFGDIIISKSCLTTFTENKS